MKAITLEDVNKYITTIRINFENSYKTQTEEERLLLLKTWYAILKDYPKEVCDVAVINAIKNAEYAPRIGAIVKEIEKMQEALQKPEHELWSELMGVLREVTRNVYASRFTAVQPNGLTQGDNARNANRQIFENLSPELKAYCCNLQGLIEIAYMDDNELSYEKARFLKTLPQLRQREKVKQSLSYSLTGLLEGMQHNLLESGK